MSIVLALLSRFFVWMYLISSIVAPYETMNITSRFLSLLIPLAHVTHFSEIIPNLLKGLVLVARLVVLFTVLGLEAIYTPFRRNQHASIKNALLSLTSSIKPAKKPINELKELNKPKYSAQSSESVLLKEADKTAQLIQKMPLLEKDDSLPATQTPAISNETSVTNPKTPMLNEEQEQQQEKLLLKEEPTTDNKDISITNDDIFDTREEAPISKEESISVSKDMPLVEQDTHSAEQDTHSVEENTPLVEENMPLAERNMILPEEEIHVGKEEPSLKIEQDEEKAPILNEEQLVANEIMATSEDMHTHQEDQAPTVENKEASLLETGNLALINEPILTEQKASTPQNELSTFQKEVTAFKPVDEKEAAIPEHDATSSEPESESTMDINYDEEASPEMSITGDHDATVKQTTVVQSIDSNADDIVKSHNSAISLSDKLQQILDQPSTPSPDNNNKQPYSQEPRPPPTPALTPPNPSSSVSRRSSMASQRSAALKNRLTTAVKKVASRSSSTSGPRPTNKKQTVEEEPVSPQNKKRFSLGLTRKKTTESTFQKQNIPLPPEPPMPTEEAKPKRSVSTKLQRGLKKSGKKLAKIFS